MRREPYWRSISPGLAIGYRKGSRGGSWIARHYTSEHGRRYRALGAADDRADPDGIHIRSFAQAQEAARGWFGDLAHDDAHEIEGGPYSVADALTDYLADYQRRGGKSPQRLEWTIDAHIRPELGNIAVTKLSRRRIEHWHAKLAETPGRLRSKATATRPRYRKADSSTEGVRRRRSSANRILTVLKAALTLAYHNRRVASAEAWRSARPFREVDAPKVRYLSDAEVVRLVNAAGGEFRALAVGALLTGARYGELAAMKTSDFDIKSGSIYVARSKSGKPRHIHLSDEGRRHFEQQTAGRSAQDLIFPRSDTAAWQQAHQFRPIREACARAKISPAIGFHVLRHTYASRLATQGVPMAVIAAQLGHADTRMTERHYAHLAPSYVATTVRAAFGKLGIVSPSKLTRMDRSRHKNA
jgi:integrase